MQNLFFILLIISPILLIVGLIYPKFFSFLFGKKANRVTVSVVFVALGIVSLIALGMTADDAVENSTGEAIGDSSVTVRIIPTTVITSWDIPLGGSGMTIEIKDKYLNLEDMKSLGAQLFEKAKVEVNYAVFVYSDREAVVLREKVALGEATEEEEAFHKEAFVGTYVHGPVFTIYDEDGNIFSERKHDFNIHLEGGPAEGITVNY